MTKEETQFKKKSIIISVLVRVALENMGVKRHTNSGQQ